MNVNEIMHLYNKHERIGASIPGYAKITSPDVVKYISEDSKSGFINYYCIKAEHTDAVISRELEYFSSICCPFEWKTYDTDEPFNIGEKLLAYGFIQGETESFMVLDLDTIQSNLEIPFNIIEVTDRDGIKDAIAVQEKVWGEDFSARLEYLVNFKKTAPENCSIYVIYENKKPVASAWSTYNGSSPFAGMWGGSTLSEYRCKGYYTALLRKRVADARKRSKKYLMIDALETSRPIVEKSGFKLIAKTTPYMYEF